MKGNEYMIKISNAKKYCCEEISLIENYDLAVSDNTQVWDCHHRLEIGLDGSTTSYKELIERGLYFHRPAEELVFLRKDEHLRIHRHHMSDMARKSISKAHKGKPRSEEIKRRISESERGINNHFYGKHHSEEARKKMSEARKAYYAKKRMTKE